MRWSDEKYVRFYTRDTIDWLALSFEAQGLLGLILRKVDRAGLAKLGKHGKRGVAVLVGHPTRWETLGPALEELLSDGCVRIEGDVLVVPNFIEAQEAIQTDAQRKRSQRERDRDLAAAGITRQADGSRNVTAAPGSVTERDQGSRIVTECPGEGPRDHAESRGVTSGHSDPVRSEPSVPSDPDLSLPACARDPSATESESEPEHVPVVRRETTPRMTGQELVQLFGKVRSLVFPGTLPWSTARDTRGDAGSFAAMLGPEEIADVEPSMRLALEHIRDGVAGWNKEQHAKDPSFAFGAWKSGFHGLREELRGASPPVVSAEAKRARHASDWRPPHLRGGIDESWVNDWANKPRGQANWGKPKTMADVKRAQEERAARTERNKKSMAAERERKAKEAALAAEIQAHLDAAKKARELPSHDAVAEVESMKAAEQREEGAA